MTSMTTLPCLPFGQNGFIAVHYFIDLKYHHSILISFKVGQDIQEAKDCKLIVAVQYNNSIG